jgi:hypothetical protein
MGLSPFVTRVYRVSQFAPPECAPLTVERARRVE